MDILCALEYIFLDVSKLLPPTSIPSLEFFARHKYPDLFHKVFLVRIIFYILFFVPIASLDLKNALTLPILYLMYILC